MTKSENSLLINLYNKVNISEEYATADVTTIDPTLFTSVIGLIVHTKELSAETKANLIKNFSNGDAPLKLILMYLCFSDDPYDF